jgi:hypothetical protein
MPDKSVIKKARKDAREGKAPSTQAGEFVKDEIDKIRAGKHGARSAKQAIAIGLSEARRAGVAIPEAPSKRGKVAKKTRTRKPSSETSAQRSRAALKALKKEPTSTVSTEEMSKFAKKAAKKRTASQRHNAAVKAAKTRALHTAR